MGAMGRLTAIRTILENEKIAEDIVNSVDDCIKGLKKQYPEADKQISLEHARELAEKAAYWIEKLEKVLWDKPVVEIRSQTGLNPVELKKVDRSIDKPVFGIAEKL